MLAACGACVYFVCTARLQASLTKPTTQRQTRGKHLTRCTTQQARCPHRIRDPHTLRLLDGGMLKRKRCHVVPGRQFPSILSLLPEQAKCSVLFFALSKLSPMCACMPLLPAAPRTRAPHPSRARGPLFSARTTSLASAAIPSPFFFNALSENRSRHCVRATPPSNHDGTTHTHAPQQTIAPFPIHHITPDVSPFPPPPLPFPSPHHSKLSIPNQPSNHGSLSL